MLDTWFTLNILKLKQFKVLIGFLEVVLQQFHLNLYGIAEKIPLSSEKFNAICFVFFRITNQQNDKLKRLSPRYPGHVLAPIQEAWSYPTFDIHESV